MHAAISVDDHDARDFWRQLLRWLVDGVPGPVRARDRPPIASSPASRSPSRAEVVDRRSSRSTTPRSSQCRGPPGAQRELPMHWTGERDGEYRARSPPAAPGFYEARVEATRGGTRSARPPRSQRRPRRRRVRRGHACRCRRCGASPRTPAAAYTPATAAHSSRTKYTGRGITAVEERELWDMRRCAGAAAGVGARMGVPACASACRDAWRRALVAAGAPCATLAAVGVGAPRSAQRPFAGERERRRRGRST